MHWHFSGLKHIFSSTTDFVSRVFLQNPATVKISSLILSVLLIHVFTELQSFMVDFTFKNK